MSDAISKLIAALGPDKRALLAERLRPPEAPIAVVGMACRFPGGANTPAQFWDVLEGGVDTVTEIPADRWDVDAFYRRYPIPATRWGAFIDGADQFDAGTFGISPREAAWMDPQQRMCLEVAWEALEDAGLCFDRVAGEAAGVFIGAFNADYRQIQYGSPIETHTATGLTLNLLAGRVAYAFDLHGPTMVVDTACSSSLVSVHLACESLRRKESNLALAGGVNMIFAPYGMVAAAKLQILSPDGRCKTFDSRANGFVRGEGCGFVVLKRLNDAEADGDRILGVIRATAVNHDGRSNGVTAPSANAQRSLLERALRMARLDAGAIDYVEAHGTGTALGDPIEVRALKEVLGAPRGDGRRCYLGSVKTNVGHLEGAAGIVALIKVLLSLQHEAIPPHLNLERLSPHISLDDTAFSIPSELVRWPRNAARARIAGLSSFGWSGTNAHAIVEEAPPPPVPQRTSAAPHVLTVSGKTEDAMLGLASRYAAALAEADGGSRLEDVCFTANARRSHHLHRIGVIAPDSEALAAALTAAAAGGAHPDLIRAAAPRRIGRVALVFGGNDDAAQALGYALREAPAFASEIDRLEPIAGRSLRNALDHRGAGEHAAVLALAVRLGIVAVWRDWGVGFEVVVGLGAGQVAAASLSGAVDVIDAVKQLRSGSPAQPSTDDAARRALAELAGDRCAAIIGVGVEADWAAQLHDGEPAALVLDGGSQAAMLRSLTELHVLGWSVDWMRVHGATGQVVSLPTYAWQHERFWVEAPARGADAHPLLGEGGASNVAGGARVHDAEVSGAPPSYLADHVIQGQVLFPGAGHLELALAAAGPGLALEAVSFERPLRLQGDESVALQVVLQPEGGDEGRFVVSSRGTSGWLQHATGRLRPAPDAPDPVALDAVVARCAVARSGADFYAALDDVGLSYGPAFRAITAVRRGAGEALVEITLPQQAPEGGYHAHPVILDACFQALAAVLPDDGLVRVPVAVARLHVLAPPAGPLFAHAVARAGGTADVTLLEPTGKPVVVMSGVALGVVDGSSDRGLHRVVWRQQDLPDSPGGGRRWLLAGPPGELQDALRRWAETSGVECSIGSEALSPGDLARLDPDAVVFVPSHDAPAEDCLRALLALTQAVLQRPAGQRPPRLWVVTTDVQPVLGAPVRGVEHAPLWGFIRTAAHEHPELQASCVDVDEAGVEPLVRELLADGPETQVALRASERYVARLTAEEAPVEGLPASSGASFALGIDQPGILDQLSLRQIVTPRARPGEVEIEVCAAGLNFLDVLLALGVIPDDAPQALDTGVRLGGECAGTITAVGPDVSGLEVGDEVMAIAPAAFASRTVTQAHLVVRKPAALSFEAAAAIPIAFATAYHALIDVARLRSGDRILIHAATGGVGMAAVQIAQSVGATIYGTAGSETKRALLRSMDLAGVMDSRTTAFADEVLAATGGEGVDVVLNSLSGPLIEQSLRALAEYGRFVEIGKRDYYEDRKLGLRQFLKGISFTLVDLRSMTFRRPEVVRRLLAEIGDRFDRGVLKVPPVQAFPISKAAEAFSLMAKAGHIGKLVLTMGDPEVRLQPATTLHLRQAASYLITGGLGALGLIVARRLVERGAKHVVLAGRGAPSGAAQRVIDELGATATVLAVRLDVSQADQVDAVVARFGRDLPALAGVVHAAGTLDDGVISQQTWRRFERVLAPKVQGARNLDAATRTSDLDFFVLFSSAAAVLGSPGQSGYAAANAYLDGLAHRRRADGLPALSIDWGPWADVGMAASEGARGGRLEALGVRSLRPQQGAEIFDRLAAGNAAQVTVLPLRRALTSTGLPFFAELTSAAAGGGASIGRQILDAPAEARRDMMQAYLLEEAASTARLDRSEVDVDTALDDFGFDSLMALEMKNRLERDLGIDIPAVTLIEGPTIAELTDVLLDQLAEAGQVERSLPALIAEPERRFEPFEMTDIQQAYLIGRTQGLELGNVGCHFYVEMQAPQLDTAQLEDAWNQLVVAHDMLRAHALPGGLQQVLPAVGRYRIEVRDLRQAGDADEQVAGVRAEMEARVFDPEVWPLFDIRVSLVPGGAARVHLSVDLLIMDGASILALIALWGVAYRAESLDASRVAEPAVTFRDYVHALRRYEATPSFQAAADYWMARVPSLPEAPALPVDRAPEQGLQSRFSSRTGRLEAPRWAALQARAKARQLTPSSVLLAAFAQVLGTWSRRQRFTLNLTTFHRLPVHPDIDRVIGDFTSTVLLEVDATAPTLASLAAQLRDRTLEDLGHAAFSGVRVTRELARARGALALMPVVFTSTLGLRRGRSDPAPHAWLGEQVYKITQTPQVSLDHQVAELDGALIFSWDAVDAVFAPGLVDEMFSAFESLVERLADNEAAWQAPAPCLTPSPDLALFAKSNATQADIPQAFLHEAFERQAQADPGRVAVICGEQRRSYGALLAAARQVGHQLREAGVRRGDRVAVTMHKGAEQVAAVLGTLMAGAAYVPVDASLPAERRQVVFADAGVRVVLTQPALVQGLKWPSALVVLPVVEASELAPALTGDRSPEDLAYVIYTSGSSGQPKGVMIDHRAAWNTIADINARFDIGPGDRVLGLSALGFDLSVFDVFGSLAAGAALVLPEHRHEREPGHWTALIQRESVTIWNSVPALMSMLVEHRDDQAPLASLRLALLSGDWIGVQLPDRVRGLVPGIDVVSLGGATEASIWSIIYRIGAVDPQWQSIPYGRPLANQSWHVLDARMQQRPVGVAGDLYIGGAGLARGYWNDEARTDASFIQHPDSGARMYRTGDIGRRLSDGDIEFLGRDDTQVKIHGHRIELGEIESVLARHDAVEQAVVTVHGRQLVGHVVAAQVDATTLAEARWAVVSDAAQAAAPTSVAPRESALDALACSVMADTLARMGVFDTLEDAATLDAVMARIGAKPRYRKLVRLWLATLEADGRLATTGDGFSPTDSFAGDGVAAELARAERTWRHDVSTFRLVRSLVDALPAVLRGEVDPLELLFADGKTDVAARFYASGEEVHRIAAAAVAALQRRDTEGTLRLLEVGAGTGGLTRYLLPALEPARSQYLFTDVSRYFTSQASRDFAAHGFVEYGLLDIDEDPLGQGHPAGGFDVIAAHNVLHGAHDVDAAMARVAGLLAPGGLLIIEELTRWDPIYSISIALMEGLTRFSDERVAQNHPFLDRAGWSDVLRRHGFAPVGAFPDLDAAPFAPFATILGVRRQSPAAMSADGLRAYLAERLPEYMVPRSFARLDRLPLSANGKVDRDALARSGPAVDGADATQVAPRTPTEETLAEIWKSLLDLNDVGVHADFIAVGGDSLIAVKLIAAIRAHFGVDLPLRRLFTAPTIEGQALAVTELQLEAAAGDDDVAGLLETLERGEET